MLPLMFASVSARKACPFNAPHAGHSIGKAHSRGVQSCRAIPPSVRSKTTNRKGGRAWARPYRYLGVLWVSSLPPGRRGLASEADQGFHDVVNARERFGLRQPCDGERHGDQKD